MHQLGLMTGGLEHRDPKAHQSHLRATYKPSNWEGIGTLKPPSCDPQATFMRPPSHLHATPKPPSCDPQATFMRSPSQGKAKAKCGRWQLTRSEEHTSELQS